MSETRILITQGEYATASDVNTVVSTLLGSCVSCCLWDPLAGVGGINHILLALSQRAPDQSILSGINDMELLINALVKLGGDKSRLKAKVFGGARMVKGLSKIGAENSEFVVKFLERERIPLVTKSLGGDQARHLKFWPATGRVLLKTVNADTTAVEIQPRAVQTNDVELF